MQTYDADNQMSSSRANNEGGIPERSQKHHNSRQFVVNNKFLAEEKLGSGTYGTVYRGIDLEEGCGVAMKLESLRSHQQRLGYEYAVYMALLTRGGMPIPNVIGVPKVYWLGVEHPYTVMVMEECGPSVEDLFNYCQRCFSLKTVYMLGVQMLRRVEYVHSRGFLHRDIKPDNFLFGVDSNGHVLQIIDFGLAKPYRHKGRHIAFRDGQLPMGTVRYCSINAHKGYELSRRDDLESVAYILIYLLVGQLPWQGIRNPHDRTRIIGEIKISLSPEELCRGCPQQITTFVQYCRCLGFADTPDYSYLRRLLAEGMSEVGQRFDWVFDWVEKRDREVFSAPSEETVVSEQFPDLQQIKPVIIVNEQSSNRNPFLPPR